MLTRTCSEKRDVQMRMYMLVSKYYITTVFHTFIISLTMKAVIMITKNVMFYQTDKTHQLGTRMYIESRKTQQNRWNCGDGSSGGGGDQRQPSTIVSINCHYEFTVVYHNLLQSSRQKLNFFLFLSRVSLCGCWVACWGPLSERITESSLTSKKEEICEYQCSNLV